ncbi:hypothetical protein EIN_418090 [Entamoeba invadens IP1]|uniref:NADPH-dependent FMN reductase-like domain-containing protein n=1 Tax=Entamoeba invadens IP1 TaxID=370355 RepID=A0A0A1U7J6_ENTIV|nr:hypothetical protein EIN_418090 [Entamoeba invadens IP1]ELP87960.1 hypothetical protein EIN_418090 [Entamoeba invadens IP1]|eukprot:XP_004254731.1 hypothetical protein EIN_418090 [Entamoeba invadens IP1]
MSLKVLIILGSPHPKGSSYALAESFLKGLRVSHTVVEHLVNISTTPLNGCKGCMKCRTHPDQFVCSQNDECFKLLNEMLESDIVVFAFPVYWYDLPGEVKLFVDRTVALVDWNQPPLDGCFPAKPIIAEKYSKVKFIALASSGSQGGEIACKHIKRIADMGKAKYYELIVTKKLSPDEKSQKAFFLGKSIE